MTSVVVECTGLSRRFDAENIPLRNVDLRVDAGQFIAISGSSGSGKSMLLNILGLLDAPDTGEYLVDGVDTSTLSQREKDELRGRTFGFVFQDAHLVSGRTAAQNLAIALHSSGHDPWRTTAQISRSLGAVGVASKINTRVDSLSGGERTRVAIARALVHEPRVLFLDEPTGNLDAANTDAVLAILESLRGDGLTIIVVTHDDAVARRADRRLAMVDGRLEETTDDHPSRSRGGHHEPSEHPVTMPARRVASGPSRLTPLSRIRHVLVDAALSLLAQPARAIMTIMILAVGAGGYITADSLMTTASHQVDAAVLDGAGDLVRLTATDADARPLGAADLERVTGVDDVVSAGLRYTGGDLGGAITATYSTLGAEPLSSVSVAAIEGDAAATLGMTSSPRGALALLTARPEISRNVAVVGRALADDIGVTGTRTGEVIWVGSRSLSIVGIIDDEGDGGRALGRTVVVGITALDSLSSHLTGGELIVRAEAGRAGAVADALPPTLAPDHPQWYRAETTAHLDRLRSEITDRFASLISTSALVLIALALAATTAASMNSVTSRRREIGIRRAIGTTRSQTALLFVVECGISGLCGGSLGSALGIVATIIVGAAQGWTPVVSATLLVLGPALGLAGGALSALLPAMRSARMHPAHELRA